MQWFVLSSYSFRSLIWWSTNLHTRYMYTTKITKLSRLNYTTQVHSVVPSIVPSLASTWNPSKTLKWLAHFIFCSRLVVCCLPLWKSRQSTMCRSERVESNGAMFQQSCNLQTAICKISSVVRRLTIGPTGLSNPARDSNPESPDISAWFARRESTNLTI